MNPRELYERLAEEGHTLAVHNDGKTTFFDGRGIADLYRLYRKQPELLKGGVVADKIVGKGAAALMIAGGVMRLYAGTVSRGALELLRTSAVDTEFEQTADHIVNRSGDGWCPVESLCRDRRDVAGCIEKIDEFMNRKG